MEIQTQNLTLVLQTTEQVLASLEAMSPAERAEISPHWLRRLRAATAPHPWTHSFSVVHRASAAVIGMCAYKGPPGPDDSVEIAYGIDPAYRERGYATEVAAALVRFAFETGRVRTVRAHTRPEANASTRVLSKCGFRSVGEVTDPEDGLVWRWEKHQEGPTGSIRGSS